MRWVKHDTDAHMDAKLQEILLDYGLEGYGLYWYCIELIAGKISPENTRFSLEHDARVIARNTGTAAEKVTEILAGFIDLGLFESTDGFVTCMKLAKRLDNSMTSNPELRKVITQVKSKSVKPMTINKKIMTESGNPMTESVKPMQEKKRRDEMIGDTDNIITPQVNPVPTAHKKRCQKFVKPTLEQAGLYFYELGSDTCQDDAHRFIDHYESNGWKVGGRSAMKDWKAAIRTWYRNSQKYKEEEKDELKGKSKAISGRPAVTFTDTDF